MGNKHWRKEGVRGSKEMKERRRKVMREIVGWRMKRMKRNKGEVMNGNKYTEGVNEKNEGGGNEDKKK